ncbi:MAG: polysaccharide biosynthesis protein [Oscillospiraceae bacterium]|nr:polysaccharide biosynthesis protein [Oscillospiraceae bacterium]
MELIEKLGIREVIIAIVNRDGEDLSKLYYEYHNLGCNVRVYDSLVSGNEVKKGVLREFSIEDLLFRNTVDVSDERELEFYSGKTVLVTGGGGSIGSEICRQIAKCHPKKLVVLDIYENNAYDIQQELIRKYGDRLDFAVEIGSVRDYDRLDEIFNTYRPDVVFHAAAHKHVPLMESCGAEAIKNNCIGTYNTANAAEKYGAEKFILISTDKAVNPTNIMGATKRICEMIVQCRADSKTSFAAVRFGNVLGSNGSVIPLFKRQIAEGGPVTITDKRIIRYFMTITEASQLVILAGAMAKKGELFVLNMGKPVKIYDLAVNMIKLSGLEPDKDIKIEEIGLRPGEKLYEELLMKTEVLDKTENNMIFIERDASYTREEVDKKLEMLIGALGDNNRIKEAVAAAVPTYRAPDEINKDAEKSEEMKLAETTI